MKPKHNHPINSEIAITYLFAGKKLTFVAALGITIGMAVYIFMNSMMAGFERVSAEAVFKAMPHIRVYKDDAVSQSLVKPNTDGSLLVIINPKTVPQNSVIVNPKSVVELLRQQPDVLIVTPQLMVNSFYNNGRSQISGQVVGIVPEEANEMFQIESVMVEGSFNALKSNANGILLAVGVADKLNVRTGDNVSITSSKGVTKVMNVVGLFQTNNSQVDKVKSYINLAAAQQLVKENATYITDINVNITNHNKAADYAERFSMLTGYKAENWEAANESLVAAARMRFIIVTFVTLTILIVAGFGIYNILNMTISQKINDIAILKAMGFKGRDVVRIFVRQAMMIGTVGVVVGVCVALLMIRLLSNVYIGGDIGFFPIRFEPLKFAQGIAFGLIITFLAGYIPARKAANVDPVSIFRK